MTPEFKKLWTDALRSGNYKQGICNWYNPAFNDYCCLGVANRISGKPIDKMGNYRGEDNLYNTVPDVELSLDQLRHLAFMNDDKVSFNKIADYIESNF